MKRLVLWLAVASTLAAGCGGEEEGTGAPGTSPTPPAPSPAAEPPAGSRPDAGGSAPPPAWVETEAGSTWLGYSTYCWGDMCADYTAPTCGAEHVPDVPVRPGETLRLHLGFEPAEVGLNPPGEPLDSDDLSWKATTAGAIAAFARAAPGQGGTDASYVGCLVFEDPVPVDEVVALALEGPMTVRGALVSAHGGPRLCSGLAESYPPQCVSPELPVRGLHVESVQGLQQASGVAWTETPISVEGVVSGGVLRAGGDAE